MGDVDLVRVLQEVLRTNAHLPRIISNRQHIQVVLAYTYSCTHTGTERSEGMGGGGGRKSTQRGKVKLRIKVKLCYANYFLGHVVLC